MFDINTKWFQDRIKDRQLSQRRVAKSLGCDPSQISLMLSGKRRFQLEDIEKFSDELRLPITDILSAAGLPIEDSTVPKDVPMIGTASTSGEIDKIDNKQTSVDATLPSSTVAVMIQFPGSFMDGWTLFFDANDKRDPLTVHTLAVVDGNSIGVIRRGYDNDSFNLEFAGITKPINPQYACPIIWIRP